MINSLVEQWQRLDASLFLINDTEQRQGQKETNDAFSEKWVSFSREDVSDQERIFSYQRNWFLDLYGYSSEEELRDALSKCDLILDAGCGLGYKAAWFSDLAPHATVLAIDYSNAIYEAHKKFSDSHPNILFAKGDIADTRLPDGALDFTVCDQVIMHTQNPDETLLELARITGDSGKILCYWYRKKALPRELLDEHFREKVSDLSNEELWKLSEEVLELGKMLSQLNIRADFPSLPSLGIEGGTMNLQRFIYWNFIKCFWNEELGYTASLSTNFDWYSPVNAKRFSREEVKADLAAAALAIDFFHEEEACYSGRFVKT